MRGSSPTPLLSRAWQCLKTVRVSVSEARDRRPQNSLLHPCWMTAESLWNVALARAGLRAQPPRASDHIRSQTPGLPASCLCLSLLGT